MPQTIRVLSVDDNDFDREVICRALSKSNLDVSVIEAETSQQAKTLLHKEKFDCVLLDYLLPPTNGLELLKSMSAIQDMPAVVMLTGMGDERVAVEALKSGAHDYLQKNGMTPQTISSAIESAIAAKQEMRDDQQHHTKLEKMSFYDTLTGLANRNLLMNRLEELVKSAKRNSTKFCLLLLDLNGFKEVNDTMGHAAGDELLKQISLRLVNTSRVTDTVARLGGDEFVILLSDVADHVGAATVARKLIKSISKPLIIEGQQVQVSVSIGSALFHGENCDSHTLLKNADQAMYEAKKSKLGFVAHTCSERDKRISRISSELPDILQKENMILHYQPKVNLISGKMCGAEVLIRWQHPALGLLPPQEFIPVAEKSDVIRELSFQLIDKVMAQHKTWTSQNRHIPLSINLSSRILSDHDLATKIESIRKSYNIDASQITFEITESALISDPRRARKILEKLAAEDFKISIDDFGTGYSTLTYLRDFPIHEVKIDKSFVQSVRGDIRNTYIIDAIVGLSQAIGAATVAEGIENIGLWNKLQAMGCDIGQGYYFSRPVDTSEIEQWQNEWKNNVTKLPGNIITI